MLTYPLYKFIILVICIILIMQYEQSKITVRLKYNFMIDLSYYVNLFFCHVDTRIDYNNIHIVSCKDENGIYVEYSNNGFRIAIYDHRTLYSLLFELCKLSTNFIINVFVYC